MLVTSRGAGGVPLEMRSQMSLQRVHTHVFSTTLELTRIACHIERSGRRSARDASPDIIAHVFSTTLELTIGTLELTRTTLELTRTTLEITRATLEQKATLELTRILK